MKSAWPSKSLNPLLLKWEARLSTLNTDTKKSAANTTGGIVNSPLRVAKSRARRLDQWGTGCSGVLSLGVPIQPSALLSSFIRRQVRTKGPSIAYAIRASDVVNPIWSSRCDFCVDVNVAKWMCRGGVELRPLCHHLGHESRSDDAVWLWHMGQTRTSVISRPPLPALWPASGSGRTKYEGRISSPKTYFHTWKSEVRAGRSLEYAVVVKLSALLYLTTYRLC